MAKTSRCIESCRRWRCRLAWLYVLLAFQTDLTLATAPSFSGSMLLFDGISAVNPVRGNITNIVFRNHANTQEGNGGLLTLNRANYHISDCEFNDGEATLGAGKSEAVVMLTLMGSRCVC